MTRGGAVPTQPKPTSPRVLPSGPVRGTRRLRPLLGVLHGWRAPRLPGRASALRDAADRRDAEWVCGG